VALISFDWQLMPIFAKIERTCERTVFRLARS
jgi:hypothetical protein